MDEWHYPVCSPVYKTRAGGIRRISDLGTLCLLRHSRESWMGWFTAAKATGFSPNGPVFSDAGLLLQAAAANQGVALGRHTIAERFMHRGELVRLFDVGVKAGCAYWAVTNPKRRLDRSLE